jgi:mono/diheme cytochrome c family protein
MRYVLLGFALAGVMILAIAGLRYDDGGRISRRPPIELFPDMDRQPKLRPQAHNNLFADQFSSRLPVEGTVARTRPFVVEGREIYPFEDNALNTGRIPGTTNFVETIPLPLTEQLLARGRQRYTINCSPCHGAAGDGKGITSRYQMIAMANFHDPRLVKMPDGEIFNTITYGKNLMGAYGPNVAVTDRWAIVAYVRALERSRLATRDDVPEAQRSVLSR